MVHVLVRVDDDVEMLQPLADLAVYLLVGELWFVRRVRG